MADEVSSCAHSLGRTETIAKLNDELRQQGMGGAILVTRGVRALPEFDVVTLLALLRDYDEFDEDNDPYGERDFGDLQLAEHGLIWKIDYYDGDCLFASPDPADATVTQRVLTVMLPSEW